MSASTSPYWSAPRRTSRRFAGTLAIKPRSRKTAPDGGLRYYVLALLAEIIAEAHRWRSRWVKPAASILPTAEAGRPDRFGAGASTQGRLQAGLEEANCPATPIRGRTTPHHTAPGSQVAPAVHSRGASSPMGRIRQLCAHQHKPQAAAGGLAQPHDLLPLLQENFK